EVLGDIVLVEQHLALQVARLDEVAVYETQVADAGAHQGVGQHRAQGAATAQRHARVRQFALALGANAVEAHLPAIAFQGSIVCHSVSPSVKPMSERKFFRAWTSCLGHFCWRAEGARQGMSSRTRASAGGSSPLRDAGMYSTAPVGALGLTVSATGPAAEKVAATNARSMGLTPR